MAKTKSIYLFSTTGNPSFSLPLPDLLPAGLHGHHLFRCHRRNHFLFNSLFFLSFPSSIFDYGLTTYLFLPLVGSEIHLSKRGSFQFSLFSFSPLQPHWSESMTFCLFCFLKELEGSSIGVRCVLSILLFSCVKSFNRVNFVFLCFLVWSFSNSIYFSLVRLRWCEYITRLGKNYRTLGKWHGIEEEKQIHCKL